MEGKASHIPDVLADTEYTAVGYDSACDSMRPTIIIVLAVLIGALLAFDAYEYDGHYREAAWEQTKHQVGEIEHTVESLARKLGVLMRLSRL